MQFSDVIGQKGIKEQLANLVQQNRLSHALLFLGNEGSGALPMAMAFAQYVVCEKGTKKVDAGPSLFGEPEPIDIGNTTPTDSCGTCPACLKAQKLIHPDIHFSYPVVPKKSGDKPVSADYIGEWREFVSQFPYGNVYDWLQFISAENKQGNITANECNEIIKTLSLKSFESEYKILIMWMPEFLGKEGNKLLKLVEEPPANTLFIFVAENEEAVLPTILSRTQLVKIPKLPAIDIEASLELRAGAKPEMARQIAAISEGNYREALQLLQHSESDWLQLVREWLNITVKQNYPVQLKWIEEVAKLGREKQKQFLKYFIHLLENALRSSILNTPQGMGAEAEFSERLNKICSTHQIEAIIEELNKASYYIERNANAKILFHALTIKLFHIIKNNSLILVQ